MRVRAGSLPPPPPRPLLFPPPSSLLPPPLPRSTSNTKNKASEHGARIHACRRYAQRYPSPAWFLGRRPQRELGDLPPTRQSLSRAHNSRTQRIVCNAGASCWVPQAPVGCHGAVDSPVFSFAVVVLRVSPMKPLGMTQLFTMDEHVTSVIRVMKPEASALEPFLH